MANHVVLTDADGNEETIECRNQELTVTHQSWSGNAYVMVSPVNGEKRREWLADGAWQSVSLYVGGELRFTTGRSSE